MPNLLEYEAKKIFQKERIPTPMGRIVSSSKEAKEAYESIGKPVAVKVQIPAGRRGRAGGIRFADSIGDAEKIVEEFTGKKVLGYPVDRVLIEEKLDIKEEIYLGVINDRAAKAPVVIVSSAGGMEVEEISKSYPEKLVREVIDIWRGLQGFESRVMTKKAGVSREIIRGVSQILYKLYWNIYRKYDAVYTEINPLCLTADGSLVAADARLYVDDNSVYRHGEIEPEEHEKWNDRERIAHEKGFGYVELNTHGEVACIANGAALGMSAMDYINEATGKSALACFLDVGGRFYDLAGDALKLVLTLPNLKAVLIHSYGGVTRADILAESISSALKEIKPEIPIFIELSGTGERKAIEIMKSIEPELRALGITFQWSSHIVTGRESPSSQKGGVDVLESPVKSVVMWSGYEYRRNPPSWLPSHLEWEKITREQMRKCLSQRPEPEYRRLAQDE